MTGNEVASSALVGFYTAHLLQWLKTQPWFPFMEHRAATLNRTTAWVTAVVAAAGIHAAFSVDATGWHLAAAGPQTSILQFLGDILRQYAVQKFTYSTTVGDHPDGK